MKRNFIYLLVVLLLSPPFIVGCGKNDRLSLEDRIETAGQEYSTSFEGVIQRLDSLDVYQQGTHQLITEDQGTIILQSSTIDLNRYLEEKVLVQGTLEKGVGDAKDVFTVTGISYLDESKNAELKNYENKTFGLKFSHPATWILEEQTDGLSLNLEEEEVVRMTVFSEEPDLDAFVAGREQGESTEVTIGAQKALRFVSDTGMRFYVPNPPKKKIYSIDFTPSANLEDNQEKADTQKAFFYNLLDSFELIYMSQTEGEKCGGVQDIQCPEEQICQLDSNEKDAEGLCVPVGGEDSQANCPYIAPPTDCQQYRISEYNFKGCPSRYECIEVGEGSESVSYREINSAVVSDETTAEEYFVDEEFDETESSPDEEGEKTAADSKEYTVPDLSHVTAVYANARKGFSLLYPKNWYFNSYGPVSGTLWKVGFSDTSYEDVTDESTNDIVTLSILDDPKGSIYKKVGTVYYVLEGPSDLEEVMKKIADSVEVSE